MIFEDHHESRNYSRNEKALHKSKESKVHIERLSPENEEISSKSPVKIVTESPLKIIPVDITGISQYPAYLVTGAKT